MPFVPEERLNYSGAGWPGGASARWGGQGADARLHQATGDRVEALSLVHPVALPGRLRTV